MESEINVVKSDGRIEPLAPHKYMLVCVYGCEGIPNVSASDLSLRAHGKLYNGITTRELHQTIVKTAVEMMDIEANYDRVAAKLLNFDTRKVVYGQYEVPPLYDIVVKNTKNGGYTTDLLEFYTKEEIEEIDSYIKHERDNTFTFAAMMQLRDKYLVQDRSTGTLYESPQVTYALVAATLFMKRYSGKKRLSHIRKYYNSQSTFMHSIPTPICAGARTPVKQFSSCTLIPAGDSLDEIKRAGCDIIDYVSQKAGVGIHAGHIRAIGSKVRDGSVMHTGIIPFIKKFKGDLKSCLQDDMLVEVLIED